MAASTDTNRRYSRRRCAFACILVATLLLPLGAPAQTGPVVTFLGVTNSQDELIDQQTTIDEVLAAVNNALNGCPGVSAAAAHDTPG